jgi:hypothetical protein
MAKRKIPAGKSSVTGGDIEVADYVLALAVVGVGIVLYQSVSALTLAGSRISDAGTRIADVGTRAAGAGDWFAEGTEFWTKEIWTNPIDWIFGEQGRASAGTFPAPGGIPTPPGGWGNQPTIAPLDGINPIDNNNEPGTFFDPKPGGGKYGSGFVQGAANLNAGNRAAAWLNKWTGQDRSW